MLLLASNIGAIIDVCAIIIILFCAILAMVRGFAKSFISSFGAIISMIVSISLCSLMVTFLENQFGIVSALSEKLTGIMDSIFGKELMNTTIEQADKTSMTGVLSSWLIGIISGVKDAGTIPAGTTLNKVISPIFGYYLSCAIATIVLYILFRILFALIGSAIQKAKKITLIRKTDMILGLILGFIQGIFVVEFIIVIINFIPLGFLQNISMQISDAPVTSFLADINVLSIIIKAITSSANVIEVILKTLN